MQSHSYVALVDLSLDAWGGTFVLRGKTDAHDVQAIRASSKLTPNRAVHSDAPFSAALSTSCWMSTQSRSARCSERVFRRQLDLAWLPVDLCRTPVDALADSAVIDLVEEVRHIQLEVEVPSRAVA